MTTRTIDHFRAEVFAGKMTEVLNHASVALQCSMGHQVGLFDTLADLPPSTSDEIAAASELQERYVREWLGAMTTGGVVEYDPDDQTYWLPPEHAVSMTTASGPDNLARVMAFIPMLAQVEESVIEAFRSGGGVPYSQFPKFVAFMADESGAVFDAGLIDTIIPLARGVPARLESGIDVADIACGRGHAINVMAEAYPRSRFVGYDFSEEAIAGAVAEAEAMGLANARFEVRDVSTLDIAEGFDLITAFDAIHDQARPADVLNGIARALRPGGTFLMGDIKASSHLEENLDHVLGPFLYTISTMHCMTVSLALGGEGLGTVWGRQRALGMLDDAGFGNVTVQEIEGDLFNDYYVATKE